MTAARETIMQALFNLVSASASFVTSSRRLKLWTDVSPSETPAIFMHEVNDGYTSGKNYLSIVEMNVELFIYTNPGMADGVIPASVMNPLLDAIDAALAPSRVTNRQTLGGLVSHCWIDGKVMKDVGDMDGQGVAIIPIKILATV
jgi:hypothetical protein